jgi:hypothetical protein
MRQITKKIIFISFFLLFSVTFIYAASPKSITLAIQGNGSPNFVEGFKYALTVEAKAAGYQVTDNVNSAKYSIKFTVEYDRIEQKSKFIVSLVKVDDSSVIVTMEYFFADEEEMMLYAQLVFFLLMANLPEDVSAAAEPEDYSWRDKWLYFNLSFDYSIMFLLLQSEGLIGGAGVYNGDFDSPDRVAPLDNKLIPMPGINFGIEFQFLNFMSIEPNVQISMEQVVLGHIIYNMLFSVELKFPLKFFNYVVIEPYGIFTYPMRFLEDEKLEIFTNYPQFIFGGGIQIAVKTGKSGALFFDVNYIYIGDIAMKNFHGELYPKPKEIHYNYSILGFRIGYKFGILNRKR